MCYSSSALTDSYACYVCYSSSALTDSYACYVCYSSSALTDSYACYVCYSSSALTDSYASVHTCIDYLFFADECMVRVCACMCVYVRVSACIG